LNYISEHKGTKLYLTKIVWIKWWWANSIEFDDKENGE